ncbi:MAG: TRCF domain-containing protein, partial [Bacteroidia bacterium]
SEEKLQVFGAKIEDRFGKLPEKTKNLLFTMKLKWQAQDMEVQKILLKAGKMFVLLPPQSDENFYQSETFGKFLAYLQDHPRKVRLKQKENGAQLVFDNVKTVQGAFDYLHQILDYETAH